VRYDPAAKPGVANLLSILAAVTAGDPEALAARYEQYGPLKTDVADAIVAALQPLQERFAALSADPAEVDRIISRGAEKAQAMAAPTLARAMEAIGLLPRA
jgi:tryptophanyl-tRNA synthetase